MTNRTQEHVAIGYPVRTPRHSPTAAPPPHPPPPDCDPKYEERAGAVAAGFFTALALVLILSYLDYKIPSCHAKFSVQSISVSPFNVTYSSSTAVSLWNVVFLVKPPSSMICRIYYDGDVAARLLRDDNELLYGAVLGTSSKHTVFSVAFAAVEASSWAAARERGLNAVVSDVFNLDIRLRARVIRPLERDDAGHYNVRCRNLTVGFSLDSMSATMLGDKKTCESSFSPLVDPFHR